MTRYDMRVRALAICLAALAGYTDALGFLTSSGFFVSFMSGNSTRFAVGLMADGHAALAAGILILSFVAGVCAGAVAGVLAGRWQSLTVLLLVGGLIAAAALISRIDHPPLLIAALLALAMGAENAVFARAGEAPVGLTYMTGSLVRIGYGLSGLITGRRHQGWGAYALLWLGLLIGALAGAMLHPLMREGALWLGSAVAVALAIWAAVLAPERRR